MTDTFVPDKKTPARRVRRPTEPKFEEVPPQFEVVPTPPSAPVYWGPPPAAPRKRTGALVAVSIGIALIFLFFIGVFVANQPVTDDYSLDPTTFVNEHLSASTDHIIESYDALAASDYDLAEQKGFEAREDVVNAYAAFRDVRSELAPEDREILLDGLVFYRDFAQAVIDMSRVSRETAALTSLVENATAEEVLYYLPEYDVLSRGYHKNADQWERLAKKTALILSDKPETALYFSIEQSLSDGLQETADSFRATAVELHNVSALAEQDDNYEPLDDRILPHGDRYDFDYVPEETFTTTPATTNPTSPTTSPGPTTSHESPAPTTQPNLRNDTLQRTLKSYITPDVKALFDQFDRDASGSISFREAQEFYYWVEENIPYRYDNENAPDPYPGHPVGDGRPGIDYHQTPQETITERLGDCEDMNNLEVAFYEYYGITSYQALVNAQSEFTIDHAIALVWVGANESEARDNIGRIDYYQFEEGDGWGVTPGAYIIVDNAYSNSYGYIDGEGIQEGKFKIKEIHTLGEEWENPIV